MAGPEDHRSEGSCGGRPRGPLAAGAAPAAPTRRTDSDSLAGGVAGRGRGGRRRPLPVAAAGGGGLGAAAGAGAGLPLAVASPGPRPSPTRRRAGDRPTGAGPLPLALLQWQWWHCQSVPMVAPPRPATPIGKALRHCQWALGCLVVYGAWRAWAAVRGVRGSAREDRQELPQWAKLSFPAAAGVRTGRFWGA
jgi:hypothetical protein